MSQTRSTSQNPLEHEEWEQVLAQLRADGFSPMESIKVTRAVLHVTLGDAKQIVHRSEAWSDSREQSEKVHDVAAAASSDL